MSQRQNKNRAYMQLRVWQDAVLLYKLTCQVFRKFPYDLKRIVSQAVASSDSVHRNIAEGHCRGSISEFINFLYYAKGSLGESVSGFHTYHHSGQISEEEFNELDSLAYKIENSLLKLIESLERKKRNGGEWLDHL